MTDFIRFPASLGNDAKPMDAYVAGDVVWQNLTALLENPADHGGGPIVTGLTTSVTAYDSGPSCLYRTNKRKLSFGTTPEKPRNLDVYAFVSVSGGATGELRAFASPRYVIPPVTPPSDIALAVSSTFTSSTGIWRACNLTVTLMSTSQSTSGASVGGDGTFWRYVFLGLQGKITSGSGTITLSRFYTVPGDD